MLTSIAQHLNFRKYAWVVAIVFSSALFGALHFWKGYRGMVSTAIGALAYSTAYVLLKRNLWPCVVAHCLGNTLGFISVYQDD